MSSYKNSFWAIVLWIFMGCLLVLFGCLLIDASSFSFKQSVHPATFLEEKVNIVSTQDGTQVSKKIFFKLDSGQVIMMRKKRTSILITPGDRVQIYAHQGPIFRATIYDYYLPLNSK